MLVHLNPAPNIPDRVVVVGAHGFIGAALVSRLRKERIPTLPISSRQIDLTRKGSGEALGELLRPTDSVVILTCLTPDKGRDLGTAMLNLEMGSNFTAAIAKVASRHVIYFSSDAVYADDTQWVTDETKAEPSSVYGAMHLMREAMLKSAAPDVLTVIRPTMVYGLADTHNSYGPNRFRRMCEKDGKITLFGLGEERRDHILIDDLIKLTIKLLRCRSVGMVLGVTGQSTSFAEIATLIANQSKPAAKVVNLPRANPAAPILHRHFDITGVLTAFPKINYTPIEEGLAVIARQAREVVDA